MKLDLPRATFKSYGGGCEYSPLFALIEMCDEDFGEGLNEIRMTLYHKSDQPFAKQDVDESLEVCYDEFHEQEIAELPKRRFMRKKGKLNLEVLADFATAEETDAADDICIQWLPNVLELLISEVQSCRRKFKDSDDFRFDEFIEFLSGLEEKLPQTQAQARKMDEEYRRFYHAEFDAMSEWEQLGIDFEDFHHSARQVVGDHRLWETAHDCSPNGNDNGADLLTRFRKSKARIKNNGGHAFLKKMANELGFSLDCEPADSIEYTMKREVVVGLAFAFLKCFSFCPQWLVEDATNEINGYKEFLQTNLLDWQFRDECLEYQDLMLQCLAYCPVEEWG